MKKIHLFLGVISILLLSSCFINNSQPKDTRPYEITQVIDQVQADDLIYTSGDTLLCRDKQLYELLYAGKTIAFRIRTTINSPDTGQAYRYRIHFQTDTITQDTSICNLARIKCFQRTLMIDKFNKEKDAILSG